MGMHEVRSPDLIANLDRLPEWKVKKLDDFNLASYLCALGQEERYYHDRLNWISWWRQVIGDEVGRRKDLADAIRRRQEKDARQAKMIEERNAKLEEEYHRNTWAE